MHFYRGSGVAAARYFDEGHRGAEAYDAGEYYTEGGGVAVRVDTWVDGQVTASVVLRDPAELVGWVEGVDPVSGGTKGLIRAGGADRLPLRFVEVVVTNPKSLSVVASQDPVVAGAVDRVLDRQADEIAGYLGSVAVTRVGGRGRQVDVGGLVVETARVRHLTSREGDPHRHVHLMVNTRVRTADGEWRGLHSAALRQHIGAVNARAQRVLLSDPNLREVLAGRGYSLGADGEIDQARGAVTLMSKRAVLVDANQARFEAAWRTEHPDREPSQRVRHGWHRQAWEAGRKAKPVGRETPEVMSERVRVELAAAGFDFTPTRDRAQVVDAGLEAAGGLRPRGAAGMVSVGGVDRDQVAEDVVAVLSARRSAWTQAELTAQVELTVTGTGVVGDPVAVGELVEDCRARAEHLCVSVLDPETHAPTVMSRHLTSPQVIDADLALNLGFAGLAGTPTNHNPGPGQDPGPGGELGTGQPAPPPPMVAPLGSMVAAWPEAAMVAGLDAGQAAAVAAVSGAGRLGVVVGPAGAGKTRTLAAAAEVVAGQGRDLVLVAPTRKAALVAGAEVGVGAVSVSKLVHDHGYRWDDQGRWTRLEPGQVDPGSGRTYDGPPAGSVLSSRSVVIVDEAGLVTVDQANALIDLAAGSGAAVRLVGDPRQLGAVGRGGVMETAARWASSTDPAMVVTLDQVHRFLHTTLDDTGMPVTGIDRDYADLSLALRDGAQPGEVVGRLVERGAVTAHRSEAEVVAVIAGEVADRVDHTASRDGGGSLAVTVATNDHARAVNAAVRDLRVAAGTVDDGRVVVGMDGLPVGAGDRVVTRRNNTTLGVANRETWTVDTVTADGGLLVRSGDRAGNPGRRVTLDADYVEAHTGLAYATTDYGNQGVTVDRSITWVTPATTAGGLYVGATRGRHDNQLHVVAPDVDQAREQLAAAIGRDRADRGLDTARTRAETEARPAPGLAVAGGPGKDGLPDPVVWRTEAELDAMGRAIDTGLADRLNRLGPVSVMSDAHRTADDEADRWAAVSSRERAARLRAEAGQVAAGRDRLVGTLTAQFLAGRDDIRTVTAGPGRFARKTGQVEQARRRLDGLVGMWPAARHLQAGWSDDTVRRYAAATADAHIGDRVGYNQTEADRAERDAAGHDRGPVERAATQHAAQTLNADRATKREQLTARAAQLRADLAGQRQLREERTAGMTPDQIDRADRARDDHLDRQDQNDRANDPRGRSRRPTPGDRDRQHAIDRARRQAHEPPDRGYGIDM